MTYFRTQTTTGRAVSRAKRIAEALWAKACKHDDIETGANFVVFSKENPYVAPLDRARGLYSRHYYRDSYETR